MNPAFWVFSAIVLLCIAGLAVVLADGVRNGEYDHWRKPRRFYPLAWLRSWLVYTEPQQLWAAWDRVRAALPRRPARLTPADAQTVTWVTALNADHHPGWTWLALQGRMRILGHIISQAGIPPTEPPDPPGPGGTTTGERIFRAVADLYADDGPTEPPDDDPDAYLQHGYGFSDSTGSFAALTGVDL